jgi:histone-lysine N-methyltransferase SETMAR
LREKRPSKPAAVLFHQDNAPPHRAARVHQFFDDNNIKVVPHIPYSPDLAPSDFWLFPTMKDTLRGRTFSSRSALATAIFQWSERTPKEAFAAAMQ